MRELNVGKAVKAMAKAHRRRSTRLPLRDEPLAVGQKGTESPERDRKDQGQITPPTSAGLALREMMKQELREVLAGPHQVRTES